MTRIILPWLPKVLQRYAKGHWRPEDDDRLRSLHGSMPIRSLAAEIGRSRPAVRARIGRLGLAKRVLWTDAEIDFSGQPISQQEKMHLSTWGRW